jgi:PST family polysaccharide transporter
VLADRLLKRLRTQLDERPRLRQVIFNTGWLFSDQVLRMGIAVVVGAWMARYLGTQAFGQLSLAQAYIFLLMPVFKFGMDAVIVQKIIDEPEQRDQILGTALIIRLVITLVGLPLLFGIVWAVQITNMTLQMLVFILSIAALFQSFEVVDFYFQSQVKSKYTVYARNAAFLVTTILKVAAILRGASLLAFAWLLLLDAVLFALGLLVMFQSHSGSILRWRFSWQMAQQLSKTSWPLIIAGLAVSAYMRIDQLMLAKILGGDQGEAAVGVYAAAVRISEVWFFVPIAIISSVFPVILQTRKHDYTLYLTRVQGLFNLLVLMSYAFALPISFTAYWIIKVLYGEAYQDAAPTLIVLAWSGVWVALGTARTTVLHAEDQRQFAMWSTAAGAVVNIGLNLILIPPFGALGCAIATLVSYAVSAYLSSYLLKLPIGSMQTRALVYPNPFRGM